MTAAATKTSLYFAFKMFHDCSIMIKSHKNDEVHFRVLATNGLHIKAKDRRFTAAGSHCHQNFKYKNFTLLFGGLCQKTAPKIVPQVQHNYFSES